MRHIVCLTAGIVILTGSLPAVAIDNLGKALPIGQDAASAPDTPAGLGQPAWDGVSGAALVAALDRLSATDELATRGAKEAKLFRKVAPSVVMVITSEGFGSGVVIDADGRIVTNWHVVGDDIEVGLIFKSKDEGGAVDPADIIRAEVLNVDEVADLALLRVEEVPATATPLPLGTMEEIMVGADVHAVGHPTGEGWTYTKGIISQLRKDYEWRGDNGVTHRADVIQTQTPINPGNSGGPLVTDDGRLIGVNSFKVPDAEGLNYAVSIADVERFLAAAGSAGAQRTTRKAAVCELAVVSEGRTDDNPGRYEDLDFDCDGVADAAFFTPDDAAAAYELWVDDNGDGAIDIVVYDDGRDGRWDESLHDTDFDGHPDLRGHHPDGDIKASRYSTYRG